MELVLVALMVTKFCMLVCSLVTTKSVATTATKSVVKSNIPIINLNSKHDP